MKKSQLIILSFLFFGMADFISAQQNTFSYVFYDNVQSGMQATGIVPAFGNGYLIAGTKLSAGGMVLKINSQGHAQWNRIYSLPDAEVHISGVCTTIDSSFVFFGNSYDLGTSKTEALFIKINASGDTLWSKALSHDDVIINPVTVQQADDSGFIVSGYVSQSFEPYDRAFAARLDANGNLLWTNILTVSNNTHVVYSVKQTPDKGFLLIGGYVDCSPCYSDAFLIKLNPAGAVSWSKKYTRPTSDFCFGYDFVNTSDGYICYLNSGLMKTDMEGNILWSKAYELVNGSNCINCPSPKLRITSDSSLVLLAAELYGMGSIIVKTDLSGNLLWIDDLFLSAADVIETEDEEILVLGNGPLMGVKGPGVNSPQIGIIQTSKSGISTECVHPISVNPVIDTITAGLLTFTSVAGGTSRRVYPLISSANITEFEGCVDYIGGVAETSGITGINLFPNPASSMVYLDSQDELADATLTIFDAGMRMVLQQAVNQKLAEINISDLSSGLYFVRLVTSNRAGTWKLVKK